MKCIVCERESLVAHLTSGICSDKCKFTHDEQRITGFEEQLEAYKKIIRETSREHVYGGDTMCGCPCCEEMRRIAKGG